MLCMVALFFTLFLETVSASPFRVLVFPHQGSYTQPQGREAVVSQVGISSEDVCNEYLAQYNSKQEWEKTGNLIDSQKTFLLSSTKLRKQLLQSSSSTNAYYFECTKSFKIQRDASLGAYSYHGNFVAIVDTKGKSQEIQIVNLVDSEQYIQGVVPAEVRSDWPAESLKAQAVAARTFAWWTVLNERRNPENYYDLNDTIEYQAYLGASNQTEATDSAVMATANQVIKYDGKVIKAYFSADSGGKTESAINAFGQDLPYCTSKQEQYDLSKVKSSWKKDVSFEELGAALTKKISSIEVNPRDIDESGRVTQVSVTITNGKKVKIAGVNFRKALKLRSTLFQLTTNTVSGLKTASLTGLGYGHGVGMAQIGAREYALQLGWTFDQILKFYYTGITLESVTNDYSE